VDGNFITLHGDKPKLPAPTQYNHVRRMQRTHAISELFTLQFQEPNCVADHGLKLPENIEPELALLMHTYHDVFVVPMGLPPSRSNDHCIPLIKGVDSVKVRPYRYPHSQKEEIEKMVSEMLQEGIIVPGTSPFSSPIVLVKKKDGTWRFCTDYRVLNPITVKDSFPIPTVDELIDELFGAQYFSKLDLRSGYHQIMVVVDQLSKYVHFAPLKAYYTSAQVVDLFMKIVVKLHGFPKSIVSDRDKVFMSQFCKQLFKLSGTSLAMSIAHHPQSEGQSEVVNRWLEMYLRYFAYDNPKMWLKLLPWA